MSAASCEDITAHTPSLQRGASGRTAAAGNAARVGGAVAEAPGQVQARPPPVVHPSCVEDPADPVLAHDAAAVPLDVA
eukprot:CAMPEP_0115746054 /NCGR_PEP_ID=MMETSP0272-20121206/92436_1 /TAXON_ID=71861 /ORGANISM="Scrippsiella trochoidea, Strain CCMP3099" /LENGTH=77 /DNA_ID=CAMNT_0003190977 /DNA_START=486 /DNA_END=717 /DNA_ORIENTATION=+